MLTGNMCNKKEQIITIPSFNLVLTPFTYTTIIGEILKCLIYEKAQIPYPFNYLENIIMRKRKRLTENEVPKSFNVSGNKQFKLASKAFDCIKDLVNCMSTIFSCNDSSNIKEIVVLFGSNTFSVKEVYSFVVPQFARGHIERNHYALTSKYQHNVLRSIFMSKEWLSRIETPLIPTNFHFLLRLSESKTIVMDDRTFELFSTDCTVSCRNAPNLKINIVYDTSVTHNCCSNLSVYEDQLSGESNVQEITGNNKESVPASSNTNSENFESSDKNSITLETEYIIFKTIWCGFKEKFVNKVPVLELY